ncbi:type II and III secretion system protein family protein [Falsiroseomonas sp. HW251]|uniref:type II and III secretion system protein family protein n=1 Tax=Falsiroseomonas sp. HW251 TaxID=3390998 RepID=UPI003D30F753
MGRLTTRSGTASGILTMAVLLAASPAFAQRAPVSGSSAQFAQAPAPQPVPPRPGLPVTNPPGPVVPVVPQTLTLEAGTGMLVQFPRPVATVLAAEPRIARVQPASPSSVFLMGADVGRTTVIATTSDGELVAQYDVVVRPSGAAAAPAIPPVIMGQQPAPSVVPTARPTPAMIASAIRQAVGPGSDIRVSQAGNALVLGGTAANAQAAYRAVTVAQGYAGEVALINNIQVLSAIQVNLRVRVAEMSRTVTRDLGFNWAALGNAGNGWTIGLAAPLGVTGAALGAGAANAIQATAGTAVAAAAYRSTNFNLDSFIDALARDNLVAILAEPNLTAQSGETASFLAGGEFPIPYSSGTNGQISVQFQQYGVALAFVPTVMSNDRINLRVRPEVSELSDAGAVNLPLGAFGSVRIPALTVRRAETTVELGSGQSFAIAGLLSRTVNQTEQGIPGLMDSVLGPLFRSNTFRRGETELVIVVTPVIVRAVSEPNRIATPLDQFRPAIDLERILERRQIGRVSPSRPGAARNLDAGFIVE